MSASHIEYHVSSISYQPPLTSASSKVPPFLLTEPVINYLLFVWRVFCLCQVDMASTRLRGDLQTWPWQERYASRRSDTRGRQGHFRCQRTSFYGCSHCLCHFTYNIRVHKRWSSLILCKRGLERSQIIFAIHISGQGAPTTPLYCRRRSFNKSCCKPFRPNHVSA